MSSKFQLDVVLKNLNTYQALTSQNNSSLLHQALPNKKDLPNSQDSKKRTYFSTLNKKNKKIKLSLNEDNNNKETNENDRLEIFLDSLIEKEKTPCSSIQSSSISQTQNSYKYKIEGGDNENENEKNEKNEENEEIDENDQNDENDDDIFDLKKKINVETYDKSYYGPFLPKELKNTENRNVIEVEEEEDFFYKLNLIHSNLKTISQLSKPTVSTYSNNSDSISSVLTKICSNCSHKGHLSHQCISSSNIKKEKENLLIKKFPSINSINDQKFKCVECGSCNNLAKCLDCEMIVCDYNFHLSSHLFSYPSHNRLFSFKSLRQLKCFDKNCSASNIYQLRCCYVCLDKSFEQHYSMVNATWTRAGVKSVLKALCCSYHFQWHTANCGSSPEGSRLLNREELQRLSQISEFYF